MDEETRQYMECRWGEIEVLSGELSDLCIKADKLELKPEVFFAQQDSLSVRLRGISGDLWERLEHSRVEDMSNFESMMGLCRGFQYLLVASGIFYRTRYELKKQVQLKQSS